MILLSEGIRSRLYLLAVCSILFTSCSSFFGSDDEELMFYYVNESNISLTENERQRLDTHRSRDETTNVYLVQIDRSQLNRDTEVTNIRLPDEGLIELLKVDVSDLHGTSFHWTGSSPQKPVSLLVIVRTDYVQGTIFVGEMNDQVYKLYTLSSRYKALAKMNMSVFSMDD